MSHRKQIEAFNRHLDALLRSDEDDPGTLQEADLQALEIARRLAALDLSAQSKQRYTLRRKLAQNVRLCTQASSRRNLRLRLQPPSALSMALPGATLLFVLVFVLGWTFANLGRLPASGDLVSATAYALPGAAIESGLPPQVDSHVAQAFAPQPLPTPIAPRQLTTHAPSTSDPNQTPSQTSPRSDSIDLTRVNP